MKTLTTIADIESHSKTRRRPAALVPTMGALHRGHLELIKCARQSIGQEGEVAVSIFVNPLQFEPGSDFSSYPRPEKVDQEICRENGVDVLFHPRASEMYFEDRSTVVEETALSETLCGASRPGHFRGVCTVVAKLFHLLRPEIAFFGEKDFQQLAIIRRMVRDLNFPVKIIGVPTVREADGLALSSRNQYLNTAERFDATVLRRAALAVKERADSGENSVAHLLAVARETITRVSSARIDYVEIVDGESLQRLSSLNERAVLALAVFIGKTRLIDNLRFQ